ncbi:hypothetical protein F2P81_019924 [Scophthalmus maximus]|uniref:Uncharacterized protein n=1 Tax=Scophthalmus maximus TaxID=52904 RepID=A0A6A4RYQ0_SCOMX|nr:hypothetical protein F2P81_019924 [Scophthalmus maximus]
MEELPEHRLVLCSAGHLIAQSDCKGTEEQEIGRTVNQRSNKVTVDDVHIQERNTVLLHFSLNEFERNIFLEQQRNQRLHS